MAECGIFDKRYSYIHDHKWGSEAADAHHIIVRKSHAKGFLVYLSPILLLASAFHLFLFKDNITITFWNSLFIAFLVKLLLQKPVEKGENRRNGFFKEVCPPVRVLVPIWKALCAATGSEGILGTPTADAP